MILQIAVLGVTRVATVSHFRKSATRSSHFAGKFAEKGKSKKKKGKGKSETQHSQRGEKGKKRKTVPSLKRNWKTQSGNTAASATQFVYAAVCAEADYINLVGYLLMPANMTASTKSSEALLKIDPEHELHFRGSSKEAICVQLKLQNITSRKVAFKVKTTAPKRYCVKPTSGILEGKGEINVLLSLQPASPSDTKDKGKHKFQVLSIPAPEGDFNVDFLWKEAKPEQIQDHKLKCVLELDDSVAVKADTVPCEAASGAKPVEVEDARSQQETSKLESELQKAAEEIRKLRDEYKRLTKENIELKEESIRVRRSIVSSSGEKSTAYVPRDVDTQIAEPGMSAPQLIMIFAAVLLGMILSKFLF